MLHSFRDVVPKKATSGNQLKVFTAFFARLCKLEGGFHMDTANRQARRRTSTRRFVVDASCFQSRQLEVYGGSLYPLHKNFCVQELCKMVRYFEIGFKIIYLTFSVPPTPYF